MLAVIDGREQRAPIHIPRPAPVGAPGDLDHEVRSVIDDVRVRGDAALLECISRVTGGRGVAGVRVATEVIAGSVPLVRRELIDAFEVMSARLRETCERQLEHSWTDRKPGDIIGEMAHPLRRVGVCVAAGAARPSTVLMAAIPAQVAGVGAVAVAASPGPSGEVSEPVLAACATAGITEVYTLTGAHAVAALAYGTESVRPVDKIVGSDNAATVAAKRMVAGWVGTDSNAAPSEVAIVAGEDAPARTIAADLVAQAERGPNGAHVLITWSPQLLEQVLAALEFLVATHERPGDVENALIEGGAGVLVRDLDHAIDTVNAFAPQQLQLLFDGALDEVDRIRNAGAVFVGLFSPVAAAHYVAGTNHLLPATGSARFSSGLGVRDFFKTVYVSKVDQDALERLAPHVDALADAEGLPGHARAVHMRLDSRPHRGS